MRDDRDDQTPAEAREGQLGALLQAHVGPARAAEVLAHVCPGGRTRQCEVVPLASRKNAVSAWHVAPGPALGQPGVSFVLKRFRRGTGVAAPARRFETERECLVRLPADVGHPAVLWAREGFLVLEALPGENLCDLLNVTLDPAVARALGIWYGRFHAWGVADRRVLLKGDPRLRNFLVHERVVSGLDFEEAWRGSPVTDVAGIAGAILDTAPGILQPTCVPAKVSLVNVFLGGYLDAFTPSAPWMPKLVAREFRAALLATLEATARRRAPVLSPGDQATFVAFIHDARAGRYHFFPAGRSRP